VPAITELFSLINFTLGTFITYVSAKITGAVMAKKSNDRKRRGLPMLELVVISILAGWIIAIIGFLSRPARNLRKWKKKGFRKFNR